MMIIFMEQMLGIIWFLHWSKNILMRGPFLLIIIRVSIIRKMQMGHIAILRTL